VSRLPRSSPSPPRESRRIVMIRNTFHRQGPFVGSGDHYSPGPATSASLLTTRKPLHGTLVPPWALHRSSPSSRVRPTRDSVSLEMLVHGLTRRLSLQARSPFTRRDRSFWSAFAEPIRDQLSPTDFCNMTIDVRATKPELLILAGTEASTSFLFLTMSRLLPCRSGDMRRAALRPLAKAPVLVLPGFPGLPNRDALSFAPPPQLAPWCVVRIDVHGPPDRVKDASPNERTISRASLGACALWRMPTTFPSSAPFGHPRSSARLLAVGDATTLERTDQDPRSDIAPRRATPSRRSGCLSPPRHAKELVFAKGLLPSAFAPALSLTPPTL